MRGGGSAAFLALVLACSSPSSDPSTNKGRQERGLGARLVFAIESSAIGARDREQVLDAALETVRNRVEHLGLREPSVYKRDGRIVVEFLDANLDLVERAESVIAKRSSLRFRLAVHGHPGMDALCAAVEREGDNAQRAVTAVRDNWWSGSQGRPTSDCYLTAPDRATLEAHVAARAAELALGRDQEIVYEELPPADGRTAAAWRTHVIHRTSVLTGAHVRNAFVARNPALDAPEVRLEFDENGKRLFALITRENIGAKLVMTLDERVLSAPVIQDEVTGGESVIDLGAVDPAHAEHEAAELANAIRVGSLPAPLRLESAVGF